MVRLVVILRSMVQIRLVGFLFFLSYERFSAFFKNRLVPTVCMEITEYQKTSGWSGIRTHAPEETGALNQRLRPLGHPTRCLSQTFSWRLRPSSQCSDIDTKDFMAEVGFEPTPPKRLVPKTSALDRSATLP